MPEYTFKTIDTVNEEALSTGVYLCIWYANKVPPHLGLAMNGSYFSLKYNGKDFGIPVHHTLSIIHKRKICTLWIKLNVDLDINEVIEIFDAYTAAASDGATCLDPIQHVLSQSGFKTVFELLDKLHNEQKIVSVSGIYLPENYLGIPLYGAEEIRMRLLKLENASFEKHLSTFG